MNDQKPLNFDYDLSVDILTIEGVKYSGDLFRHLGFEPSAEDQAFQIVKREDGALTIRTARGPEVREAFEDNTGKFYAEGIPLLDLTPDEKASGEETRFYIGVGTGVRRQITRGEAFRLFPAVVCPVIPVR